MDPGRQFDRPSIRTSYRTVHSQIREGERDIDPGTIDRAMREGIQVPDKTRPTHVVYHWTHPETGDLYKVAHVPGSGIIPTVMREPGLGREAREAAEQRARQQTQASAQSAHQTRTNKAAQEEKQARRDWSQRFTGEFPGMDGYKAAKASAKKK